ncbi:hypothetical protein [Fundidesulfovibrio terrae]|uniref:hypothetical protein n=1 Tax=Fundidesulfovibrio terrae TaxID=2922866 RepID=UPI001FAF81DE|nr:hypothetical protein [Fundidesulfovibrio terrae]
MDTILSLETPPDIGYARVLTTAAEALARSRGLAAREQMRFQLAVEEFFTYLAQVVPEHGPIRTVLTGKPYQVCASIRFQASGLCLGALNAGCTAVPAGDGETGHPLSLMLAGRVADRFRIDRDGGDAFILHAEVDKAYPPAEAPGQCVAIRPPYRAGLESDPSLLMHAAALAASRYPAWHCPASFQTPGKFADMSGAGRFFSIIAQDAASHPAGILCWARSGDKGLAFSGPFVFAPPEDAAQVARLLTDAFLAAVAREKVEIVFSERATPDAPDGYFESLGSLTLHGQEGPSEQPVLYRHLREDAGETVWAAPELEGYLRGAYDRLAMCRDILTAHPPAAFERKRSLLSTTLDKNKGLAVLRPLLDGEDASANLAAHVQALSEKGVPNVLLYLDLSRAWEAALAGPAMEAGFRPRLVLPFAGRSDVLVFQHAQSD